MGEIVFMLGAGALHEAGAPLMRQFLDAAEDLKKKNEGSGAGANFNLVFKGVHAYQMAAGKSNGQ